LVLLVQDEAILLLEAMLQVMVLAVAVEAPQVEQVHLEFYIF
jgi:hypothetical protein